MHEQTTIRRILEYALEREHQGIAFFKSNAIRLSQPAAQQIFLQLVAEEEKHAQFILGLLEQLEGRGAIEEFAFLAKDADLFSMRALSEEIDQTVYESMIPDVTILRMAFLIEQDFASFYRQAAEKTSGEAKKALEMLADWEAGHEKLFRHLHDTLFERYMEMPWGG